MSYTHEQPHLQTIETLDSFDDLPDKDIFTGSSLSAFVIRNTVDQEILSSIEICSLPAGFQYYFYGRTDIQRIDEEVSTAAGQELAANRSVSKMLGRITTQFAEIMSDFGGDSSPFASLRVVDVAYLGGCTCGNCERCLARRSSVSRDWHIDTARFTLTTALAGAQIEYTPNENVIRDYFAKHKIMQPQHDLMEALHDPDNVIQKEAEDIVILKGELRARETTESLDFLEELCRTNHTPYHEGLGLVHHAAPPSKNGKRLVLTVSTYA